MAGSGGSSINITQLKRFKRNLDRLSSQQVEKLANDAIKEIARNYLASVVRLTPVGQYTDGRVGGTLRRGWTANDLRVTKSGNVYQIEIINAVEYGLYVNNGHRTRNNGFVYGQFFVEIAAEQVEGKVMGIVTKHVNRAIREALNGN